eukprot:7615258-Alexandrium_andersonii.AAC.1
MRHRSTSSFCDWRGKASSGSACQEVGLSSLLWLTRRNCLTARVSGALRVVRRRAGICARSARLQTS